MDTRTLCKYLSLNGEANCTVFMRKLNVKMIHISNLSPPTICLFLDNTTFIVLVYVGGM